MTFWFIIREIYSFATIETYQNLTTENCAARIENHIVVTSDIEFYICTLFIDNINYYNSVSFGRKFSLKFHRGIIVTRN